MTKTEKTPRAFSVIRSLGFPSSFVIRHSSFPPWHLPHLLGLDAPLVAVAWQLWWARSLSSELGWIHHAVLALAVWMIYLADRLADAATLWPMLPDEAEVSARHHFAWRHRRALATLLLGVIGALAVLTLGWLTSREFRAGLGLLAVQVVYFAWIHSGSRSRGVGSTTQSPLAWRKEAWVGGSFALGTFWFAAWASGGNFSPGVLVALAAWSAVCFLNCALISHWEQGQFATAPGGDGLGSICATVAAIAAAGGPLLGRAIWPVALAAAGLWWVDHLWSRDRLSRETARVLADVVLLTPFPLLIAS